METLETHKAELAGVLWGAQLGLRSRSEACASIKSPVPALRKGNESLMARTQLSRYMAAGSLSVCAGDRKGLLKSSKFRIRDYLGLVWMAHWKLRKRIVIHL